MDKETKLKTLYFYLDLREKKIPTLVFSLKKIKEKEKFNKLFLKAFEIGYESFELGNDNLKFYFELKEKEKEKLNKKEIYIFLYIKYDMSLLLDNWKEIKNINYLLIHYSKYIKYTKYSNTFEKKGFYNYSHSSYLYINNASNRNKPQINERIYNPLNYEDNIKKLLDNNNCLTLSKSIFCSNNKLFSKNPFLKKLKKKYNKSIYQILIRWNLQKKNLVIIKTDNEEYLKENFDVFNFELKEIEMKIIDYLNNNLLKFENDYNQIKYIKCLNENCFFPALIKFKDNKIISSCQLNHENEIYSLKDYYFELNNLNENFTKCNKCQKKFKNNQERLYCKICDYYFHNFHDFHNFHFGHGILLNKETILTKCPFHLEELKYYSKEKETAFCELCKEENYENLNYEKIQFLNQEEEKIVNFLNDSNLECCNEEKYFIKEYLYYKEKNILNYHIIQSTKNIISLYPKILGNYYFSDETKKKQFDEIKNNFIIYFIIKEEEIIVYDIEKNLKLFKFENGKFNEFLNYGKYNLKNIFLQSNSLSILTKDKMFLFDSYLKLEEKEEKEISENVIYCSYSIIVENFYNNEIIIKQRNKETNEYSLETFIRNKPNINFIVLNDKKDDKNQRNINHINDGYLNFLYSYSKNKYLINYTLQNYKSSNFLNCKNSKKKFTKIIPYDDEIIFFITNNFDIYYWKLNDEITDDFQLFKSSEEVFKILSSCNNIFKSNETLVLYSNEKQEYLSLKQLLENKNNNGN
jgi:hypothetical protein